MTRAILALLLLSSCSTLTTPMRECKAMCQGPVVEYTASDSETCKCREKP